MQTARSRTHSAHPRSRGENSAFVAYPASSAGSSPLTRGKRLLQRRNRLDERLIPAHAGKTRRPWTRRRLTAAHPRSRGENQPRKTPGRPVLGSSPLTRGKRWWFGACRSGLRLIPAHAGKTLRQLAPGELSNGSSPLTRGKPVGRQSVIVSVRLIPAHAGKTGSHRRTDRWCRAHPRSRGENSARRRFALRAPGSSPLTRGKRGLLPRRAARSRLIPAHAGKTRHSWARRVGRAAHPRSRGENT